jgi:hypothetical protein
MPEIDHKRALALGVFVAGSVPRGRTLTCTPTVNFVGLAARAVIPVGAKTALPTDYLASHKEIAVP